LVINQNIGIILEWILRQQNMRVRIGFVRFRRGTVMDACNALINVGLLSIKQTLIMR
jgi:hypothetical protein